MPKAKTTTASSREEDATILDYMTKANRPYSATDVFNNLHGKISKGNVTKVMDRLVENGSLMSKAWGKQSVYCNIQDTSNQPTVEEVEAIDKAIIEWQESYDNLAHENRETEKALARIRQTPTTEEAKANLERIKQESQALQEELDTLKNTTTLIPPEERKRVDQEYERNRKIWKQRINLYNHIIRTVGEHYPPKQLLEDIGIDEELIPFDEDVFAKYRNS